VAVNVLADEIGWSRRHFTVRFRDQVGLPPKPAARVLRFRRAADMLAADPARSITEVAAACGYADHSPPVRELRRLAGCTPSAFVPALLPDGAGVAGGRARRAEAERLGPWRGLLRAEPLEVELVDETLPGERHDVEVALGHAGRLLVPVDVERVDGVGRVLRRVALELQLLDQALPGEAHELEVALRRAPGVGVGRAS